MSIVYIIIGMVMVLLGADKLTEGASALARRMNIPEIVIVLTIVAFGTSMPEFFVSLVSALKGNSDLALGNVVGSNIFNALFIVGCTAVVAPMTITKATVRKDIPFAVFSSLLLCVLCMDSLSFSIKGSTISRIDGIILLLVFAVFLVYTFRLAKNGNNEEAEGEAKPFGTVKITLYIVLGLVGLVWGSDLFVDGASDVARSLGVSDGIIGLTLVACGTSLPELATSVVAARKGKSAIAIGNVIGSNVFNILAILGITAVITPMRIEGITMVDMLMMLISMLLLWMFSYTKYTVARWEGGVLMVIFGGYLTWLITTI